MVSAVVGSRSGDRRGCLSAVVVFDTGSSGVVPVILRCPVAGGVQLRVLAGGATAVGVSYLLLSPHTDPNPLHSLPSPALTPLSHFGYPSTTGLLL